MSVSQQPRTIGELMQMVAGLATVDQRVRVRETHRQVREAIQKLDDEFNRRQRFGRLNLFWRRGANKRRRELSRFDCHIQDLLSEINARHAQETQAARVAENRRFSRTFMRVTKQELGDNIYARLIEYTKTATTHEEADTETADTACELATADRS